MKISISFLKYLITLSIISCLISLILHYFYGGGGEACLLAFWNKYRSIGLGYVTTTPCVLAPFKVDNP